MQMPRLSGSYMARGLYLRMGIKKAHATMRLDYVLKIKDIIIGPIINTFVIV